MLPEIMLFPVQHLTFEAVHTELCYEEAVKPVTYNVLRAGTQHIHAGQDDDAYVPSASMIENIHAGKNSHVYVSSASMIESIHAAQDNKVDVPGASAIESIHVGQDNNAHAPSASMIEVLAKIIRFMSLVHP